MRVIAGTARGTNLKAPKNLTVRPTADRVKEALFNIIAPRVANALFIDFYAGSGAIGIESLSRGASFCIFVERKKDNVFLIKENLAKTRLEDNARIILGNVEKAIIDLAAEKIMADLVFLDPPYNSKDILAITKSIFRHKIIADSGLLIVEHAHRNRQWAEVYSGMRQNKYGDTCLTLISPINTSV